MSKIVMDDPDASGIGMPALAQAGEATTAVPAMAASKVLSGPVWRALIWLAVPVLAEQFLNTLVGLTDLWLARHVSNEATIAVGVAGFFSWLVQTIFTMIGIGATAIVARSVGAGIPEDANHSANQAVGLSLIVGIIGAVFVILFAPLVPPLFGLKNEAVAGAITFLRIDAIGHILSCTMFVGNACLRGAGDTRTPMRVMLVVNIVNMVSSASLVFGLGGLIPRLGVSGIAAGTAIARLLGGALVLAVLLRGRSPDADRQDGAALLRLHGSRMWPHGPVVRRLLRIGIPAGLDGVGLWLGQLVFMRIINGLATGTMQEKIYAAHVTGVRIESLTYLPAYAWAIAAATMVGQSLGARDERRAARSGYLAAGQAASLAAVLAAVYFFLTPQLYGFFSADPEVVRIGVPALKLLAFFQVPLAIEIVFRNALRGAGDTRYPLLFTLVGMFTVRMPVAYLCGHVLGGGLVGAWVGMCSDILLRSVLATVRFLRGGWKRIRV